MKELFRCSVLAAMVLLIVITELALAEPAYAYVGPGAGLTAIGTILALVAVVFLSIVGFVWYPVKRLLRRKNASGEKKETGAADQDDRATKS